MFRNVQLAIGPRGGEDGVLLTMKGSERLAFVADTQIVPGGGGGGGMGGEQKMTTPPPQTFIPVHQQNKLESASHAMN